MVVRRLRKLGWELAHRPSLYWLTAPLYHRLAAPVYRAGGASVRFVKGRLVGSLNQYLKDAPGEGQASRLVRRWIWRMNRSYRPAAENQASLGRDFNQLLSRIATGEAVDAAELLPYLCLESRAERAAANAMLADAYWQRRTEADLKQARVFIERAWLLSDFSKELFPLYKKICSTLKDAPAMRAAYKRLGMRAASRGEVAEAIEHFTWSHYADLGFNNQDRYEFDFDIMAAMDALAAPHRFDAAPPARTAEGEKIRLAYLVKGVAELNSVLVKINLLMARLHDKSRFDVTFFMPEPERVVAISPQGKESIRAFENYGCRVVTAPNAGDPLEVLLALAREIHDSRPHLLVTSAAMADFNHYFITALRPAPVVMGLVQGPPPQFAPPILDWGIAWTKHPLMDSPINCSLVELKLEYAAAGGTESYSRAELDLPEEACVLLSGGRFPKFQGREQWEAIINLLSTHADAYYLVVGTRADQIPFLDSMLTPEVKPRVRCLGWREDFLKILPAADIVVDTYPSGGGQVLVQAMAGGIPIVAHRNDYMQLYDQANWSPVEDFITDAEVVIARGDFERFKQVVSRLIEDEEYRGRVGERCREAHLRHDKPEQAVRRCEEIYLRILERFR